MILVDTSVWVQHFRTGNDRLKSLLLDEQVLCHPFVLGELACGRLRQREEVLKNLSALPEARVTEHNEAVRFIEDRRLYGQGLGWVDINLLASSLLSKCSLWTFDRSLYKAAIFLGIAG